ncbi:NADH-quinone oxidoreductase subunit C [Streptomyces sp. NPDC055243]|uniref:NADH-quinone oxidoreductase subunit C n=1 Tax=Streptomyces sp. NPDC055243 TaxID=3365720 RepID=UPI0037D7E0B8
MTGWLPSPVDELFGAEATADESYDLLTVDVPPGSWIAALETARTTLACTYFDWLSAVDEPGTGFLVSAHVVALSPVRRLLIRTTVPHDAPVLPTAIDVYAGAAWHERETHEMFGVAFEGHPNLVPLLLPETFEGHPLRKDFVLAARVAKAWPGAKEPGESEHGGPKRRQMLPPGVPDPNEWGPLKGQLPAAPARPARGAARAAGDRPARRTRTAGEGSAGQRPAGPTTEGTQPEAPAPRRSRSVSQGSASQQAAAGPAAARPAAAGETRPEAKPGGALAPEAKPGAATAPEAAPVPEVAPAPEAKPEAALAPEVAPAPEAKPEAAPAPETAPVPEAKPEAAPAPEVAPAPEAKPEAAPAPEAAPPEPKRARPAAGSDAPWHQARPAFEDTEKPAPDAPEQTADTPADPPADTPADPPADSPEDNDRPGGTE